MATLNSQDIIHLYETFSSSTSPLDCGEKCGAYNENHKPFCCDIHHVIASAYPQEWQYLDINTNLWHSYPLDNPHSKLFQKKLPEDHVLLECLGYQKCQRNFRSISCRSFPFFPYIDKQGRFIGLAYYWEYEDRCWLINNLPKLSPNFRDEFVKAFDFILNKSNQDFHDFRYQSMIMRRVFSRKNRTIPLVSRNPTPTLQIYKISPKNGRMRKANPNALRKFGYYHIAEILPFPEENA